MSTSTAAGAAGARRWRDVPVASRRPAPGRDQGRPATRSIDTAPSTFWPFTNMVGVALTPSPRLPLCDALILSSCCALMQACSLVASRLCFCPCSSGRRVERRELARRGPFRRSLPSGWHGCSRRTPSMHHRFGPPGSWHLPPREWPRDGSRRAGNPYR